MDKGTESSEFSLSLGVQRLAVCCSSPTFLSTLRHSLKIQITSNASHWESLGNVFGNYPINTKYNAGGRGEFLTTELIPSHPAQDPAASGPGICFLVKIEIGSRRLRLPAGMVKVGKHAVLTLTTRSG